MKISDITAQLGITNTTLANWISEFGDFFSDGAKQRKRQFTESDLLVLATIAKYSNAGFGLAAIREKLMDGERVNSFGEVNFGIDVRMVPAAAMEQVIDSTEIKAALIAAESERDRLSAVVHAEQARNAALLEEIKVLQEKIATLQHQLGRAEGRLEEMDKKPRRWPF